MTTYYLQSGPRSILKDPHNNSTNNIAIWKKVCFDDVHIREYAMILGDNPAVSKGAPVQITWDYHNDDVIDVDIFEHCREPVRRHRKKCVLSARKRAKILLGSGHSVEEIADMTLQCQEVKRMRVETVKNAGGWDLANLNVNLADFMTGTAEVTGRTLQLVGMDAVGQGVAKIVMGTGNVVLGTGKFATDVVVGTGKLGVDVVVGTGKMVGDVAVGTGRVGMGVVIGTGKVVVGTGRVASDVVLGTGQMLKKGTESVVMGTGNAVLGTLKGTGKAARRITNIFSQGDLIDDSDLTDTKQRLKHVEINRAKLDRGSSAPSAPKGSKQRHNTELSPQRSARSPVRTTHRASPITRTQTHTGGSSRPRSKSPHGGSRSPHRSVTAVRNTKSGRHVVVPSAGLLTMEEGAVMEELTEMERFMKHLKHMDPEQVKRVLANPEIQA